ncbi:uncharacterized protein LOC132643515 isoform X2 [Lycium barbarum]|nr:uncharacterized protein LOC132643515 isoform X2 [Lycium barbarum]
MTLSIRLDGFEMRLIALEIACPTTSTDALRAELEQLKADVSLLKARDPSLVAAPPSVSDEIEEELPVVQLVAPTAAGGRGKRKRVARDEKEVRKRTRPRGPILEEQRMVEAIQRSLVENVQVGTRGATSSSAPIGETLPPPLPIPVPAATGATTDVAADAATKTTAGAVAPLDVSQTDDSRDEQRA